MKYIKLFENKILDDILDKMLDKGKDSLTKLELDYLNAMQNNKESQVENKMKKHDDLKNMAQYDPRKDSDFYKKIGMSFDEWSDDDISDGKLNILWDKLPNEDMENFLKSNELDDEIGQLPWHKLDDEIQEYFKVYLYENDILKSKQDNKIDYQQVWDILTDDDMDKFLSTYHLSYSLTELTWDKLPSNVKKVFMDFAIKSNLL
jgi:hypothetical protein